MKKQQLGTRMELTPTMLSDNGFVESKWYVTPPRKRTRTPNGVSGRAGKARLVGFTQIIGDQGVTVRTPIHVQPDLFSVGMGGQMRLL